MLTLATVQNHYFKLKRKTTVFHQSQKHPLKLFYKKGILSKIKRKKTPYFLKDSLLKEILQTKRFSVNFTKLLKTPFLEDLQISCLCSHCSGHQSVRNLTQKHSYNNLWGTVLLNGVFCQQRFIPKIHSIGKNISIFSAEFPTAKIDQT